MEKKVCFADIMIDGPDNKTIQDALGKAYQHVQTHDKIQLGISGGSDSDIMLHLLLLCGGLGKVTPVFHDTGLEYDATRRHLDFLEQEYGVKIVRVPPVKSIPRCVREHGVPFWSKRVSEMIMRLQKHDFKWEDKPLTVLLEEYPNCKAALRWWCNDFKKDNGDPSPLNISWVPYLKEFIMVDPPGFPISPKCCHYSKKEPAKRFAESGGFDMVCTGVRKAEGGDRAISFSSCFSSAMAGPDTYRPLFWFTDADKAEYKKHYGVVNSDCYEVWGMKRTGCAGCPYGKDFEKELELVRIHEPKFYKAMVNIFGQSYDYTRRFLKFREEMKNKVV